jgi:hypothetical protein
MGPFDFARIDPTKETDGVWFPYAEGVQLRVARHDNPKFQAKMRELLKPFAMQVKNETLPVTKAEELFKLAASSTLLVDWSGVLDPADKTKPLAYSPELALSYFNDPALRDFYRFVIECSKTAEAFRVDQYEERRGNS